MTDLEKFIQVLKNQPKNQGAITGWPDLDIEIEESIEEPLLVSVKILNLNVGFVFDEDDRLLGGFNWKD